MKITSIFQVKKKETAITNRNVEQVPPDFPYWLSLLTRLTGYFPNALLSLVIEKKKIFIPPH